jgi:hypothetical protein
MASSWAEEKQRRERERDQTWVTSPGGRIGLAIERFLAAKGDLDCALAAVTGEHAADARAVKKQIWDPCNTVVCAVAPLLIALHKHHKAQLN